MPEWLPTIGALCPLWSGCLDRQHVHNFWRRKLEVATHSQCMKWLQSWPSSRDELYPWGFGYLRRPMLQMLFWTLARTHSPFLWPRQTFSCCNMSGRAEVRKHPRFVLAWIAVSRVLDRSLSLARFSFVEPQSRSKWWLQYWLHIWKRRITAAFLEGATRTVFTQLII